MDIKFTVLAAVSLIQLSLLLWHIFSYRSKKAFVYFVVFGLFFGFFRAKMIYLIQIVFNNSYTPYAFNEARFKIGNDSLQIYIGWLSTVYLSWCLAEVTLKAIAGRIKNNRNLDRQIFPIISVAYFFTWCFSYSFETLSSFMKWWSWNSLLEANIYKSLFVNVPWVGLVDISTVAIEYLGVLLLVRYAFLKKDWSYLSILFFPVIHWMAKLDIFPEIYVFDRFIHLPTIIHLLIPLTIVLFFKIRGPELDHDFIVKKTIDIKSHLLFWIALDMTVIFSLIAIAFFGRKPEYYISLIPLTIFYLLGRFKLNFDHVLTGFLFVTLIVIFLPLDFLTKQRIIIAFFPLAYFSLVFILDGITLKNRFLSKKSIITTLSLIVFGIGVLLVINTGKKGGIIRYNSKQQLKGFNLNKIKNKGEFMEATQPTLNLSPKQKKVMIVTIDTLRADRLGVYGYNRNTSENIDRFARDRSTVVFRNGYTPEPETVPAHVSLFTGLYPKNSGYRYNANRNQGEMLTTLAKVFFDNGYRTAGFYSSTIFTTKDNIELGFETYDPPLDYNFGDRGERSAEETNNQVFKWLDENYKSDFFLWVHYYEPHNPYIPSCVQDYFSKDLKPTNDELIDGRSDGINNRENWTKLTKEDLDYLNAIYDEEIYCVDKQFGRLINKLKQLQVYDEATIILLGDHGENFDHNSLFHGFNLYQSAVHIPYIVKSPFMKTDGNQKINVSLIDIFPTLADYFGFKKAQLLKVDGLSLRVIPEDDNRILFFETAASVSDLPDYEKPGIGVMVNSIKFINNDQDSQELYYLESDPAELNNLIKEGSGGYYNEVSVFNQQAKGYLD